MGWSINLFSVGGTVVRLHLTFFFLLAWIAAVYWSQGGPQRALYGVIFIILLFVCVLLHEFGHVWAARRYGIRTPDVTILPIGGVAKLERMPEKPSEEIFVALAGPAVNLVIAAILIFVIGVRFDLSQMAQIEQAQQSLLGQVAAANVALFVFNLIPAFPMDGGRVLRALLALRLGFPRATQIAAFIGQGFAVALGFLGLFGNPLLVLVAVFVFLAAAGEAGYVQAQDLTRGRKTLDAAVTNYESLNPLSSIDDAAALLLSTTQQEFPVLDGGGKMRGFVIRKAIVDGLREKGGAASALEIMNADIPTIASSEPLEAAFELLQRGQAPCIGVLNPDGQFMGFINSENINEFIMIVSSRGARSLTVSKRG